MLTCNKRRYCSQVPRYKKGIGLRSVCKTNVKRQIFIRLYVNIY